MLGFLVYYYYYLERRVLSTLQPLGKVVIALIQARGSFIGKGPECGKRDGP